MPRLWSALLSLILVAGAAAAGDGDGYRRLVVAYADEMLEYGRDHYGEVHSPLFASALHRADRGIGEFPPIEGVRAHDRSQTGANPQYDQPLYAILYRLGATGAGARYPEAADDALRWFFRHCQSPQTGLMAWGEHIYWDFRFDGMAGRDADHEIKDAWPFWDRCYVLAPDASWRFALGLWDHQVADHESGEFSRHARWSRHGPQRGTDFPRYAGQMILTWAEAYAHPANAGRERRDDLLRAIAVVLGRMEHNRAVTASGYLRAGSDEAHAAIVWPGSNLELARCLWLAAPLVDDGDLAARMRRVALAQDRDFHRMPHRILEGGGFAATLDSESGEPRSRSMNLPYTSDWHAGYGYGIHAGLAGACLDRLRQLAADHPELAAGYRPLVVAVGERYLATGPDEDLVLKPGTFASVIDLLLDVAELTGDARYRERARALADRGVALFIDPTSPLPKATQRHEHYEAITGGPAFMHSLLRLAEALDAAR